MDENEKYIPEENNVRPESADIPEIIKETPLDVSSEPILLPPSDPMLGPVSGVAPSPVPEVVPVKAVPEHVLEEPIPAEPLDEAVEEATVYTDDRYARPDPESTRRGPTADEIKNYRVNQPQPSKYNQPRSTDDPARQSPNLRASMSIAAFILGLLGLLLFWIPYVGFVLPALAVLFGAIGLVQSQSQPGQYGGRGFAIAGIVLGLIGLGVAFLTLSVLGCVFDWFRAAFQVR